MTIKELIEELKKLPPDETVLVWHPFLHCPTEEVRIRIVHDGILISDIP
jgi:hypothetical protein